MKRQCGNNMGNPTEKRKQICSQVLQTVCVTWARVMVGISDALLGPSLLDLQALLQTDLGMLNYLVLVTGLFDFVGAILAGFLAKTADVHLRLCVVVLFGALAISMSAMVANFYYVLVAFSLQGLLRGAIYCYSIEKSSGIWPNKGVTFQIIALGPSVGGVIAPWIINMFLCEPKAVSYNSSSVSATYNHTNNIVPYIANDTSLNTAIVSKGNLTFSSVPYVSNDTSINTTIPTLQCSHEDVRISYAYIILGLLSMPPVAGFFVFWRKFRKTTNDSNDAITNETESNPTPNRALEIIFSVIFVIYYFPLLGGSIVYGTFLTEFGVSGPLHLEKSKMVLMTSLFWGSSLAGRIINIFLTPWLGVEKIIIVNIIPLLICETVLISWVSQCEIILWVCTCAVGIFISPYIGTGCAWCAGVVKLDSKIISASGASLALGGMAVPFIGGLFFQNFGPMSFLYFFYANYVFVTILFFIMFILSRKLKQYIISLEINLDPSSLPLQQDECDGF